MQDTRASRPNAQAFEGIDKQNDEFKALTELKEKHDQLTTVAVVDDDYPSVRHEYEIALKHFLKACAINRPRDFHQALHEANVGEAKW